MHICLYLDMSGKRERTQYINACLTPQAPPHLRDGQCWGVFCWTTRWRCFLQRDLWSDPCCMNHWWVVGIPPTTCTILKSFFTTFIYFPPFSTHLLAQRFIKGGFFLPLWIPLDTGIFVAESRLKTFVPGQASSHGTKPWSVLSVLPATSPAANLHRSPARRQSQWWKRWRPRLRHWQVGSCRFEDQVRFRWFLDMFGIELTYMIYDQVYIYIYNCRCLYVYVYIDAYIYIYIHKVFPIDVCIWFLVPECTYWSCSTLLCPRFLAVTWRAGEKAAFKSWMLKYHGEPWPFEIGTSSMWPSYASAYGYAPYRWATIEATIDATSKWVAHRLSGKVTHQRSVKHN